MTGTGAASGALPAIIFNGRLSANAGFVVTNGALLFATGRLGAANGPLLLAEGKLGVVNGPPLVATGEFGAVTGTAVFCLEGGLGFALAFELELTPEFAVAAVLPGAFTRDDDEAWPLPNNQFSNCAASVCV